MDALDEEDEEMTNSNAMYSSVENFGFTVSASQEKNKSNTKIKSVKSKSKTKTKTKAGEVKSTPFTHIENDSSPVIVDSELQEGKQKKNRKVKVKVQANNNTNLNSNHNNLASISIQPGDESSTFHSTKKPIYLTSNQKNYHSQIQTQSKLASTATPGMYNQESNGFGLSAGNSAKNNLTQTKIKGGMNLNLNELNEGAESKNINSNTNNEEEEGKKKKDKSKSKTKTTKKKELKKITEATAEKESKSNRVGLGGVGVGVETENELKLSSLNTPNSIPNLDEIRNFKASRAGNSQENVVSIMENNNSKSSSTKNESEIAKKFQLNQNQFQEETDIQTSHNVAPIGGISKPQKLAQDSLITSSKVHATKTNYYQGGGFSFGGFGLDSAYSKLSKSKFLFNLIHFN